MSTGQLVFYSGVALLFFTIILGIVFWVKKPQYIPANAAYDGGTDRNTRKLRSGYPTDRLTIRREPEQPIQMETAVLQENTAPIEAEQGDIRPDTAVLPDTGAYQEQQTEKLDTGTVPLAEGTAPLTVSDGTVKLDSTPATPGKETAVLDLSTQSADTEKLGNTTMLSDSQGG